MKRYQTDERTVPPGKRANYIALGVLLLALVAFVSGIFIYKYRHTFTTQKWVSAPEYRALMLHNFLNTNHLIGMTQSEVTALLGENDNDDGYFNASDRFVYCLGLDGQLFKIDNQWLLIDFVDGVVADYSVTRD